MAADEALTVHEELERRFGIDWQILYAPVILAGGLALAHVVHRTPLAPCLARCSEPGPWRGSFRRSSSAPSWTATSPGRGTAG